MLGSQQKNPRIGLPYNELHYCIIDIAENLATKIQVYFFVTTKAVTTQIVSHSLEIQSLSNLQ